MNEGSCSIKPSVVPLLKKAFLSEGDIVTILHYMRSKSDGCLIAVFFEIMDFKPKKGRIVRKARDTLFPKRSIFRILRVFGMGGFYNVVSKI